MRRAWLTADRLTDERLLETVNNRIVSNKNVEGVPLCLMTTGMPTVMIWMRKVLLFGVRIFQKIR
jgi:hypothetical protein